MRRFLPVLVLGWLFCSCAQPSSTEQFLRSDGSGEYNFELELADTLASYDLSFYSVIDRPLFKRDTLVSFPLQVVWRSPSGRYFSETVYYPSDSLRVRYRSGVIPSEGGTWSISVSIGHEPSGFRGLGVICSQNKAI
ncbi:MAG: hypothetical protein IKX67_04270 [Bacteroidales bacterium]|nr:hypothetical protein [Bacteroidales bacterium]